MSKITNLYLTVIILLSNFISDTFQQLNGFVSGTPANPCPDIFQYEYDGGEWFGHFEIPSPPLGQTIKLNVMLSLRAQLPSPYVGAVELYGSRDAAIQEIKLSRPVRYRIRFPVQSPLPKLTEILYNNNIICGGPPETGQYVTAIKLEHILYTTLAAQQNNNNIPQIIRPMQSDVYQPRPTFVVQNPQPAQRPQIVQQQQPQPRPQIIQSAQPAIIPQLMFPQQQQQQPEPQQIIPQQPNFPANNEQSDTINQLSDQEVCGQAHNRFRISPLIVGGQNIPRGSWPWLAAVYINKATGLSFNCGGNLVSTKVVVTAAHCFKTPDRQYSPNEVVIFLGRYNILNWSEEGSKSSEAQSIYIHTDYMKNDASFDADIAVVVLKTRIQYNDYIRPICLWQGTNDVNQLEGVEGTVVGWGRDGNGNIVTPEPKKISVPIVSDAVCLRSSDTFRYITSKRTFCAGGRDGRGPCNGDSGSGMTMLQNKRWSLRGIVSAALADPVMNTCNLSEYVVFTDASKFVDWLRSFMNL